MTTARFAPKFLKEFIDAALNATIFENGNVGSLRGTLKLSHQLTNVEESKRFLKEGLRFLNHSIPQSMLILFRNGDKNELDEKEMSLFELWQNTKLEIESGLLNASIVSTSLPKKAVKLKKFAGYYTINKDQDIKNKTNSFSTNDDDNLADLCDDTYLKLHKNQASLKRHYIQFKQRR